MFRVRTVRVRRFPATLALAVLLVAAFGATADARDHVPTPPGGGPGVNLWPADQQNVLGLPAPGPARPERERSAAQAPRDKKDPDLGGDDIEEFTCPTAYDENLAAASNGDLFSILWWDNNDDSYRFTIRRSNDGGTTWFTWATFYNSTPGYRYWNPRIHIAEGNEDRCFVAYTLDPDAGQPTELHLAWSPIDLAAGDFSHDTVIASSSSGIMSADVTSDAASFNNYYVYLTYATTYDATGEDIYFVRSIDQGTTWESPYVIATIGVTDRGYYSPRIAVGYGGYVHVFWYLGFPDDHEYDHALRYRRAANYAGGGLASWENMVSLTSHLDGVTEYGEAISASWTSADVMVAAMRRQAEDPWGFLGVSTLSSANSGASWTGTTVVGSGLVWAGNLLFQDVNDRWILGLDEYSSWGFRWAPAPAPADWSALQVFSDDYYSSGEPALVLDPSHADRIGIVGGRANADSYTYLFDAEWRTDPGYPNFEDGFPVTLTAEPVSDPAVVDLDGDGDLEIVFGDDAGYIRAYRSDGTPLPGWPVNVGTPLSPSPIAIGDLKGDGTLSVVAGTNDGRVFAYHTNGTLMAGWPYDTMQAAPAYVAIGALGPPYPRAVVVAADNQIEFIDWHGERYPASCEVTLTGRTITSAPAVGDIDGDGRSEAVIAASQTVCAFQMSDGPIELYRSLESSISGGISLADFDLDGEVEIVAPLSDGVLHLLQEDGSEFGAAWPVTVADSPLRGTALANFLGSYQPEIAVTAQNWLASVVWYNGNIGIGWPVNTGGWIVYGKPVVGLVEGTSGDVIVGARGYRGWAWDNFGSVIPGWPKTLENHVYQTPAYGDIDLDGRAEIVFLTPDQLVVVDVGAGPGAALETWAMAGHDAQRTGCADCAEDVVAVEEAPAGITRVSLAAPWPNPITSQATFAYDVPVRAQVELAIYDISGRRVTVIERAELAPGRYELTWNGRDGGRPVASGHYVAVLRVRGPGLDQTQTRKITVLR